MATLDYTSLASGAAGGLLYCYVGGATPGLNTSSLMCAAAGAGGAMALEYLNKNYLMMALTTDSSMTGLATGVGMGFAGSYLVAMAMGYF